MTIMLMENIQGETYKILFIFSLITLVAVLMELIISAELFGKIKKSLLGYEPNVFTAMFKVRDNILESLNEGIVAVDKNGIVQFANTSAMKMSDTVCAGLGDELVSKSITDTEYGAFIAPTLASGEKSFNGRIEDSDILIDVSAALHNQSACRRGIAVADCKSEDFDIALVFCERYNQYIVIPNGS